MGTLSNLWEKAKQYLSSKKNGVQEIEVAIILNPVEQLYIEFERIATCLEQAKGYSELSDLNKNFRKVLLLSAGSYFEHEVTSLLSDYVSSKTNNDERLVNFLQRQAISGKYFQLFDWGKQDKPEEFGDNANRFFSFFGDNYKKEIAADLKNKGDVNSSIEAFIEIGHLRNILVHSNFAAYSYEQKTTQDIYELFQKALPFLVYLKEKFQ